MAAPKHWMLDKLTGVFVSAGRERAWGWGGLVPGGFPGSGAVLGLPVGWAGQGRRGSASSSRVSLFAVGWLAALF